MELELANAVLSAAHISGDPKRLELFIKTREDKIAALQQEIAERRKAFDEAPARIARAQAKVDKIKQEQLLAKNRADVNRLRKLTSALGEVSQKGNP